MGATPCDFTATFLKFSQSDVVCVLGSGPKGVEPETEGRWNGTKVEWPGMAWPQRGRWANQDWV